MSKIEIRPGAALVLNLTRIALPILWNDDERDGPAAFALSCFSEFQIIPFRGEERLDLPGNLVCEYKRISVQGGLYDKFGKIDFKSTSLVGMIKNRRGQQIDIPRFAIRTHVSVDEFPKEGGRRQRWQHIAWEYDYELLPGCNLPSHMIIAPASWNYEARNRQYVDIQEDPWAIKRKESYESADHARFPDVYPYSHGIRLGKTTPQMTCPLCERTYPLYFLAEYESGANDGFTVPYLRGCPICAAVQRRSGTGQ